VACGGPTNYEYPVATHPETGEEIYVCSAECYREMKDQYAIFKAAHDAVKISCRGRLRNR
jgi:hypothetical protein